MANKDHLIILVLALVGALFLLTCDGSPETATPPISPLASPQQSPLATPTLEEDDGARFDFLEPLRAGDTTVSGEGPANMEILIVDVTLMNREIGSGKIDSKGTFDLEVASLSSGHRIGILPAGDLTQDAAEKIAGDGARFMGREGWLLETAIVQEE